MLYENVFGISNIKEAISDECKYEDKNEFNVVTLGKNLEDMFCLSSIDQDYMYSNDVTLMLKTYGIETAMVVLQNELSEVLGDGVESRHILMLVDSMCFEGVPFAVNRHGLSKTGASELHRASFEETIDTLMSACMFGKESRLHGITDWIMTGTKPKIGSGMCELQNMSRPKRGREIIYSSPKSRTPPGTPPGTPQAGTPPGSPESAKKIKLDDAFYPRSPINCNNEFSVRTP